MKDAKQDVAKVKNIYVDTLENGQPCRVEFNKDITIAQYSRNSLEGFIDLSSNMIAGNLAGYKFLVPGLSASIDVIVLK